VSADKILQAAAATFAERNKVYGDNWTKIGSAMQALFPDGITLVTAEDHVRFYYLLSVVQKLTRYSNNFATGGHQDSIHDVVVYSAMLEDFDAGSGER
jgi:hypothetical protein